MSRIRATSTFIKDGAGNGSRARVPAEVKFALNAHAGDRLIFAEGCEQAVFEAALKGKYFIVSLERETKSEVAEQVSTPLESFEEAVRKRVNGKE